jgi:hypothetical protein
VWGEAVGRYRIAAENTTPLDEGDGR